MDGSLGALMALIIKWSFLLISILGISRLLKLRKDGKKHFSTKVVTATFIVLSLYSFIGSYIHHKNKMKELAGNYNVEYFNCEKCSNCIVYLNNNGTYQLRQNKQVIVNGNWDYEKVFVTTFIIIDGSHTNKDVADKTKTISHIKSSDCIE